MSENPPATIPRIEVESGDQRLSFLTEEEISHLTHEAANGMQERFRRCCLGILHAGTDIDSTSELLRKFPGFRVALERSGQGVKFVLTDAPTDAFIDGHRIHESMREHLCSAAIDLIFHAKHIGHPLSQQEITDAVFHILRHASVFERIPDGNNPHKIMNGAREEFTRITCWGGHAIRDEEYQYTKAVGRRLGERYCEAITGGGGGAMRGPFSGLTAAYAAERITNARMFGFNCPGIITSEPPNLFVKPLVILPDIEKRLEAFVRASQGIIVFPGGPGTAEEIKTILSILLYPDNEDQAHPVILTGPESARPYIQAIDTFLRKALGADTLSKPSPKYEIIIDDPERVAQRMMELVERANAVRKEHGDTRLWNGSMQFPRELQIPFDATHENVEQLEIHRNQPPYRLCTQMRQLFSAIVAGNVTEEGIRRVRERGPFRVKGDPQIICEVETLLRNFVAQGRMKLRGEYEPCYEIVR
ncbi:MAG: nucleotide 5'-monophosphate nucleosidase PpnN [Candidatus Peribacteraceae bacterium]|nr:nucleotide 5'-monophosphate nucleosidase PpnN [Candidatus Peribacteraceae bacterium]